MSIKNEIISVIIPTYNRANLICHAIDSVLAQNINNLEILVIDDGSTDDTAQVLKSYERKIQYIHQDNAGVSAARNHGLRKAKGNWIAFLDSDDTWHPQKLSLQIESIQKHNADICFTNISSERMADDVNLTSDNSIKYNEPFDLILQDNFALYIQTVLVKKELISKMGGFNEGYQVAEDTYLIYQLALEIPFIYIDQPLLLLDRSEETVRLSSPTFETRRLYCDTHIEIADMAYQHSLNKDQHIQHKLKHILSHYLSLRAMFYCADRAYSNARRDAMKAIRYSESLRTTLRALRVLVLPWFTKAQ